MSDQGESLSAELEAVANYVFVHICQESWSISENLMDAVTVSEVVTARVIQRIAAMNGHPFSWQMTIAGQAGPNVRKHLERLAVVKTQSEGSA